MRLDAREDVWHAAGRCREPARLAGENDPVNKRDPTGASTWIDKDGFVQDVRNDQDLSIYMQESVGPPKRVGATRWWDAFRDPDSEQPVGRIMVGKSSDAEFDSLAAEARSMSIVIVGLQSGNYDRFDIKRGRDYEGTLFRGAYVSRRELGDILAGYNASSAGLSFELFQKMAGALARGSKWSVARTLLTGKEYGDAPMYGENEYEYLRALYGWNLAKAEGYGAPWQPLPGEPLF